MALAHGIRACWSTRISSSAGNVLGAFAIYYPEPRMPTPLDQTIIDQFTHIASITVERQRSQEALTSALDEIRTSETYQLSQTELAFGCTELTFRPLMLCQSWHANVRLCVRFR
jgi:GAF domain-containing protein